MEESVSTLPNGQVISFFDYGDSQDSLFFHHATQAAGPLSRALKHAADVYRFRIIEVVRPGYGNTSSLPDRNILDFAPLNLDLADHLGIEKFGIIAYSGGGPHALASTYLSKERCVASIVVAGMASFVESDFNFYEGMDESNEREWLSSQQDLEKFKTEISHYVEQWSGYDFEKLKSIFNSGAENHLSEDWIEAFSINSQYSLKHGPEGILEDSLAYLKPWGFSPSDIHSPVQIWAGDADVIAPTSHARWLHQKIAGSELCILEGKDHNSVVEPAWDSGFPWIREIFNSMR